MNFETLRSLLKTFVRASKAEADELEAKLKARAAVAHLEHPMHLGRKCLKGFMWCMHLCMYVRMHVCLYTHIRLHLHQHASIMA